MAMVETDHQPLQQKTGYVANSAMAAQPTKGTSASRRNAQGSHVRAAHSQYTEENQRTTNTGYLS